MRDNSIGVNYKGMVRINKFWLFAWLISLVLFNLEGRAQSTAIWGIGAKGIFRTDANWSKAQMLFDFISNVTDYEESYTLFYDDIYYGKIFGTYENILFSYDTEANKVETLYVFGDAESNGISVGIPVIAPNGKMYGVARNNNYKKDFIYEYDIINDLYTKKVDINSDIYGYGSKAGLTLAPDGFIYGVTFEGGKDPKTGAASAGILYKYDPGKPLIKALMGFKDTEGHVCSSLTYGLRNSVEYLYGIQNPTGSVTDPIVFYYNITYNNNGIIAKVGSAGPSFGKVYQDPFLGRMYGTVSESWFYNGGVFHTNGINGSIYYGFPYYYSNTYQATFGKENGSRTAGLFLAKDGITLMGINLRGGYKVNEDMNLGGTIFTIQFYDGKTGSSTFVKRSDLYGLNRSTTIAEQDDLRYTLAEIPLHIVRNELKVTVCDKPYVFNGVNYDKAGYYVSHFKGYNGADSILVLNLNFSKISGDKNCNGIIDNGEIAGDKNQNGIIDDDEFAGDVNGNGKIDGDEILGDSNGDYKLNGDEVAGDRNGDGKMSSDEGASSYIASNALNLKTADKPKMLAYEYKVTEYTSSDGFVTLNIEMFPQLKNINLGDLELGLEIVNGDKVYIDSIVFDGEILAGNSSFGITKTYDISDPKTDLKVNIYSKRNEYNDTTFYTYLESQANKIDEPLRNNKEFLYAYPNPASTVLNIEVPDKFQCSTWIGEMYTQSGQLIRTFEMATTNGIIHLSVEDLPIGSYILKTNCGATRFGLKFNKI